MLKTIVRYIITMSKPEVVFVLGGPGAGKGTQCENIVKEFGYLHLSAGDLLREERNRKGSEFGELIENHIRNGSIVPVEITCSLLERAMNNSGQGKFLIDGFPRNQDNLDGWNRSLADKVNLKFVINFDCPLEVCTQRCLERGATGSGRSDDNLESLKKRLKVFETETRPILQYYKNLNLVRTIDASKSKEEVFGEVKKIFCGAHMMGDMIK